MKIRSIYATDLPPSEASSLTSKGLGYLLSAITEYFGATPWSAHQSRAMVINHWMPNAFLFSLAVGSSKKCRTFSGPCTRFGKRKCVSAPDSFTPDAGIIEQCCSGCFQYLWIEICEGKPPRQGCGFCLW